MKKNYQGDYSIILQNLDPEIDVLSNPEDFLMDYNNWISCTVASKLYNRAKLMLGDENAAYKIAQYAVENTISGYVQRIIVKAFWSTTTALKNGQKINDKWNRNKRYELVEIKKNEAVVRLHWNHEMDVSKDFCLMNQGTYTYLPTIWGGKPPLLEEKCCYFEGDPYCEYHFKWSVRNRFSEIFSRFFKSKSVLVETIKEMEKDKKLIEEKYEEVNRLNLELHYKIKQVMAIHDTGKAILSVLDLEKLLTVIMNILSNVCRIYRAIIMMANENEGMLEYIHGIAVDGAIPEAIKKYRVPLDRTSNILARVASTGRPEYVPEVKNSMLRKDNIVLIYGKPTSVYVVPLITRSRVIGVIATDAVDKNGVSKETRETLELFAPHIAIAIENAKLYSQLQKQMEELKQSHALLSRSEKLSFLGDLAARLAHEIKNPMTAIGTFIQMLPQKYDDEEFMTNFHKIALEETKRINNLITELLDLVKTRESNFEPTDLHNLIDKMILLLSPITNEKKINFVKKYDQNIGLARVDPGKIRQVILNLLSNAVDFTPHGGKIELVTQKSKDEDASEAIRIEVRDNGSGIPDTMIDKVFDPYFTTKHKSNMHKGTGLGLFIAHKNMQEHGGTIEVKSKVDKGTTFVLTFPVDA